MVEALYQSHARELEQYCTALCKNAAAAQDLMQEVFLRALTHIADLEPLDARQRRAWLYKTARNLFLDTARRNALAARKTAAQQEEACESGFSGVETQLLLSCLPYDLRLLFEQRYFLGYNATELGEFYGVSPATIRSRLLQARSILKRQLQMP